MSEVFDYVSKRYLIGYYSSLTLTGVIEDFLMTGYYCFFGVDSGTGVTDFVVFYVVFWAVTFACIFVVLPAGEGSGGDGIYEFKGYVAKVTCGAGDSLVT